MRFCWAPRKNHSFVILTLSTILPLLSITKCRKTNQKIFKYFSILISQNSFAQNLVFGHIDLLQVEVETIN